jgi:polyhydroxyalkanoate synthesis repressor PhaR
MSNTEDSAGKPGKGNGERVVIQKYANRRLYNKATSTYITLDNLAEMVREGVDFVVYDAKSNEDITRKVLTQIIFDEENNSTEGKNLLPIQFLRQLIGFYGDNMQAFLPSYLEMSLEAFSRQQDTMRTQFTAGKFPTFGASGGLMEEQVRQNMMMFDRAMKMFSPFSAYTPPGAARAEDPAPAPAPKPAEQAASDPGLDALKDQLAAMQAQIEKLASKG